MFATHHIYLLNQTALAQLMFCYKSESRNRRVSFLAVYYRMNEQYINTEVRTVQGYPIINHTPVPLI